MRFNVYKQNLIAGDAQLVTRDFVVLEDDDGYIFKWTDLHRFVEAPGKRQIYKLGNSDHRKYRYVVMLLNYCFFDIYHVSRVTDITIEMIQDFLQDFAMCRLIYDDTNTIRSKVTVELCVTTVIDFFQALGKKYKLPFKNDDLYINKEVFNKRLRKMVKIKVPVFKVTYQDKRRAPIFRDIPEKAFEIIFNRIAEHHTNILMLAALSSFAGLRPSEACNVRRADSALGPGLRFDQMDGEISNISIDLRKEMNLRSDMVKVGSIKKERVQKVYPAFLNAFYECYKTYMTYIQGRPYEKDYGALTVNKNGKALTYDSYLKEFKQAVSECIPIMLSSSDPEIVIYGQLLQENSISPHIFRHWFSMQLALYGATPAELMHWRGDTSPESAITYINNKSDITKQLNTAVDKIFDFNSWRAEQKHNDQSE